MTYFDTLEADFTRYYQIDLPAAVWGPGPISARRFRSLVRGLPQDSALSRELNPEWSGWGNVEELLATTIEVVDLGNRILHAAYCKEPHPDPIEIRRPGRTPERPKMATSEEMVSFFKRTGGI